MRYRKKRSPERVNVRDMLCAPISTPSNISPLYRISSLEPGFPKVKTNIKQLRRTRRSLIRTNNIVAESSLSLSLSFSLFHTLSLSLSLSLSYSLSLFHTHSFCMHRSHGVILSILDQFRIKTISAYSVYIFLHVFSLSQSLSLSRYL